MLTATPLVRGPISVMHVRCDAGPGTPAVTECHGAWTVAVVRRGSFGCRCGGRGFELVPGSLLVGRPGDEYVCTHDHHDGGDECLSFHLHAALVDEIDHRDRVWASGVVPPLAETAVLDELARGDSGLALDEVGVALASRYVAAVAGRSPAPVRPVSADRRRVVDSALRIAAHAADELSLQQLADAAGWSACHYLRVFSAVLGVTPHQYLVRCRLRQAARALVEDAARPITEIAFDAGFADLSNFVRSFHRAAGTSPRGYRRAARGDRKIFQERLARAA
jgi:AraC-like DNA-binding protein